MPRSATRRFRSEWQVRALGAHLALAQEQGRLSPLEAKRLAGYLLMASVGSSFGDRTTSWRYRKLAERADLGGVFDSWCS
jgi:hypothetical protein